MHWSGENLCWFKLWLLSLGNKPGSLLHMEGAKTWFQAPSNTDSAQRESLAKLGKLDLGNCYQRHLCKPVACAHWKSPSLRSVTDGPSSGAVTIGLPPPPPCVPLAPASTGSRGGGCWGCSTEPLCLTVMSCDSA